MSPALSLVSVPDDELLERLTFLVDRHRRCEAELVAHLAEVDTRKLHLGKACSSMFSYCVEVLHLSEHEAYLRIACARASRRFPVLLDMLADGRLHLSAIAKLAPHLTDEDAEALLERAVHKTKREVEELCAEVAPRPDVAARMRKLPRPRRSVRDQLGPDRVPGATSPAAAQSATSAPTAFAEPGAEAVAAPAACAPAEDTGEATRAVVEPIAPARYKVQFTASAELRDKLSRAEALLRQKQPDCDLAEVVDEAVTLLLGKLERRRFGKSDAPRKSLEETDTSATSRHVPAAVKRAVYERDQGRCAFVNPATGKRCSCTDPGKLEYHHTTPFARGSDHDPDRIELRCRAHNQHQAVLDFGAEKMARHRNGASRARERSAAYGSAQRRPLVARAEVALSTAPLRSASPRTQKANEDQAAAKAECGATLGPSPAHAPTRRGPPQARARRGPPPRVRPRWFGRRRFTYALPPARCQRCDRSLRRVTGIPAISIACRLSDRH